MMAAKKGGNVTNLRKTLMIQRPGDGADVLLQETMVAGTYRGEKLPYWRKLLMRGELTKLEGHAALLFSQDYARAQSPDGHAVAGFSERVDGTSGVDARIAGPLWRLDARTRVAHILLQAGDRGAAALKRIVGDEWTVSDFVKEYPQYTNDTAKGLLQCGLSSAARHYRLGG